MADFIDQAKDFARENFGVDLPTGVGSLETLEDQYNFTFSNQKETVWQIDPKKWHQVFSYRFLIRKTSGGSFSFAMPIPPQQLMIKPVLPNLATPTFGGVVEEVSPVKFWMINMAGTMGTGVSRDNEQQRAKRTEQAKKFREVIETTGILSGAAASANKVISRFGGLADQAVDTFGNVAEADGPLGVAGAVTGGVTGGVTGAINQALVPPLPYSGSAVDGLSNGFSESHNLLKFLYFYQALKAKDPDEYQLHFISFKTDQSWRCVVKDAQLQRSAQNPNLERYQITLQGWNCQRPGDIKGDTGDGSFDRFGPNGDLKAVNPFNAFEVVGAAKDNVRSIRSAFFGSGAFAVRNGGSLV